MGSVASIHSRQGCALRSGGAYDALAVEVAVEDFLRQRARAAPEPPPQEQQQQQQRHAQDLEEWLKWFGGDDSDDEADVISDADVTAFEEYFKQHPPDLDALAEQAEAMAAAGRGARRAHLNRRL